MRGRVLIVDDDRELCEQVAQDLLRAGFEADWRTSAREGFEAARDISFDVVLTDLRMPELDGIDLCTRIVENRPDVPVVVMTAFGDLDSAVASIRAGAYDFVSKPVDSEMLALVLDRAVRHRALEREVCELRLAGGPARRPEGILGESEPMRRLFETLDRLAESDTTILVLGETGTGKELVARALHAQSSRRSQPFVAINCAAVPESLLESELFGHVRGAFTDARSTRVGLFEQARGGTLLLDEIADMPIGLQPKLLRALESRKFRPIGSDHEVSLDVRLVAATNRDPESAVEEGRLREDLYYRINVVQIELPSLRERGRDVLLLAQHFIDEFAADSRRSVRGMSRAVAEKLLAYSWPGNVRELRNSMERAVALTRFEEITVEDLPERIRAYRPSHLLLGGETPGELPALSEVEQRYILHVMEATRGNRTLAARILGLDRKTLYRKLQRYAKGAP